MLRFIHAWVESSAGNRAYTDQQDKSKTRIEAGSENTVLLPILRPVAASYSCIPGGTAMGTNQSYVKVLFDLGAVPEIQGGYKFKPALLSNEFSTYVCYKPR